MKPRKTHNLEMLAVVAKGIKDLKKKVVFVGGATVELYLNDEAAAQARFLDSATDGIRTALRAPSRPGCRMARKY